MSRPRTLDKRGDGGVMSFALSGSLKAALEGLARRENVSKSFVVREALRRWFAEYDRWNHSDGRLFEDGEAASS